MVSGKLSSELEKEIEKRVRRAVIKTTAFIQQETPVDTGRLRGSIDWEEKENGYIIGTSVPYAEFIELGVEPFEIFPKDKLALYWKGASHPVKKVKHPGFRGKMMFHKGLEMFPSYLKSELAR